MQDQSHREKRNVMSGAKDLADMENIYKPAAECCTGIYVSTGILPGKVRRNSMKTRERVLDANLDPGRSPFQPILLTEILVR